MGEDRRAQGGILDRARLKPRCNRSWNGRPFPRRAVAVSGDQDRAGTTYGARSPSTAPLDTFWTSGQAARGHQSAGGVWQDLAGGRLG